MDQSPSEKSEVGERAYKSLELLRGSTDLVLKGDIGTHREDRQARKISESINCRTGKKFHLAR